MGGFGFSVGLLVVALSLLVRIKIRFRNAPYLEALAQCEIPNFMVHYAYESAYIITVFKVTFSNFFSFCLTLSVLGSF
jgi:hypothetical protein